MTQADKLTIRRYTFDVSKNELVYAGKTMIFSLAYMIGFRHEYDTPETHELYNKVISNGVIFQIEHFRKDLKKWCVLWNISKEALQEEYLQLIEEGK